MIVTNALLAVLVVALAAGLLLAWRRQRLLGHRLIALESRFSLQAQSIGALTTGSRGVDERIARLEARERVLSERQDVFESEQADERPYNQAIRLVQQGAGSRRLVEELGLSESEADLIIRLHGEREPARLAGS